MRKDIWQDDCRQDYKKQKDGKAEVRLIVLPAMVLS